MDSDGQPKEQQYTRQQQQQYSSSGFVLESSSSEMPPIVTHHRSAPPSPTGYGSNVGIEIHTSLSTDDAFTIIPDDVEAHRISNNYLFGFKKWKSHISTRPVENRSEIVQDLYSDINKSMLPVRVSTVRPTNILYILLIGWWLALIYVLVGTVMFLSYFGRSYGFFCLKMARYFLWPFGFFVHLVDTPPPLELSSEVQEERQNSGDGECQPNENTSLLNKSRSAQFANDRWNYWYKPKTYLWFLLGVPILLVCHVLIFIVTWLLVITIPIAKINSKTIRKVLFLPPEHIDICNSNVIPKDNVPRNGEIIMYTHQSVNIYYYKYTVDGMNVICVNLLLLVIAALVIGFVDSQNFISPVFKCLLALFGIVPVTYYIGTAITSISAQSNFAVGALLNATFGSIVEVILYVITLKKGQEENSTCYPELVKSALAGTILATMLLIPGLCMVIGGLKYQTQRFNPRSTSVGSSLLFVSVAGVFAPTLFSEIYGDLHCSKCEKVENWVPINGSSSDASNSSAAGMQCSECSQSLFGLNGDTTLYDKHILPLVYTCALFLPISYIIGLIFSMKTHFGHVYHEFYDQMAEDGTAHRGHHHGSPQWSRIKCILILFVCTILVSLLADIMANNLQPLMESLQISEYFIGVTLIAILPELPEVVNGIQFALQNNVAMGIEIAINTAIQCCLLQVPLLILINLIYPFGLYMIFSDVHMFAVIFAVIVMNYTLQDGRSNYFQGSALLLIYFVLMAMYFFTPTPKRVQC